MYGGSSKPKVAARPPSRAASSIGESSSQPRVRARVDPSAVYNERPALRSTRSTASLRSDSGRSSAPRATSPIPPVPKVPKARVLENGTARVRSISPIPPGNNTYSPHASSSSTTLGISPNQPPIRAKSPGVYARRPTLEQNGTPSSMGMSRTKSSGAQSVSSGPRTGPVKVKATSIAQSFPKPLPSPPLAPQYFQNPNHNPTIRRPSGGIHSNLSSPGIPSEGLSPRSPLDGPYFNRSPHLSTTSIPSTPTVQAGASRAATRMLPPNPNIHLPITPRSPASPEVKPVPLPITTPIRDHGNFNAYPGRNSMEDASVSDHRSSMGSNGWGRRSPVKSPGYNGHSPLRPEINKRESVEVTLSAEAEEARVNRKVADLEISNASLMAINKTLEANKAKQRAEINRLRGLLQEALSGDLSSHSTSVLFQSNGDDLGIEEEMVDPALEERWTKVEETLSTMREAGEKALKESKEHVTIPSSKRVLGWAELERPDSPTEDGSTFVDSPREVDSDVD